MAGFGPYPGQVGGACKREAGCGDFTQRRLCETQDTSLGETRLHRGRLCCEAFEEAEGENPCCVFRFVGDCTWTNAVRRTNIVLMPYHDFDTAGLAAYLHLTPQQVDRLAERGRLPGRKVAGQWRFARPDIHHWFEQRIGLGDEDDLVEVEDVLERDAPSSQSDEVSLVELLQPEAIAIPLSARTKNSVITAMVNLAAATGRLWDPQAMAEAVKKREELYPTALGNGVALLHPRRPMPKILSQPTLALGCTTTGIPFGAGAPLTDVFFLICSTEDRGHLQILARLSRVLAAPGFLSTLRQAPTAAAARQLILETEQALL